MERLLSQLSRWCLDLVFPKHCLGCQTEGSYLCPDCQKLLTASSNLHCFICQRRSPAGFACSQCLRKTHSLLAGILVAADWENLLLRQIVYEYKYRFIKELALPLSSLITDFLNLHGIDKLFNCPADQLVIIPVPLHKRRLSWRGFNQSELLAKLVVQKFNLPLASDVLLRHRYSLPQMGITDKNQRRKNITNSFTLSTKLTVEQQFFFKNKTIILIDDISTTAATLEECAKTLKALKPKEIWGLVIARG